MSQQDGFYPFILERYVKAWTTTEELQQLYSQVVSELGIEPGDMGPLVGNRLVVKVQNLILSKRGLPTLVSQDGTTEFSVESLRFLARFVGMTFEASDAADNCGVVMEEAMLFADRRDASQPPIQKPPRAKAKTDPPAAVRKRIARLKVEERKKNREIVEIIAAEYPNGCGSWEREDGFPSDSSIRNYRIEGVEKRWVESPIVK